MDPRYTDFGELEFVSIASYNIIEKNKKSVSSPISFVQQLKAMSMLGWGGGGGGGEFCILLTQSGSKRTIRLRWKSKLKIMELDLT